MYAMKCMPVWEKSLNVFADEFWRRKKKKKIHVLTKNIFPPAQLKENKYI